MSTIQGPSRQGHTEQHDRYIEDHIIIPPLDYSFLRLVQDTDLFDEEPRNTSPRKEKIASTPDGKSPGRSLKLNNNNLTNIENLHEVVNKLFSNPSELAWLDLSFNALTNVSDKLLQFKELQILYLHGNDIGDLSEIKRLAALPKLKKLTLHGNPFETEQGYRMHVLSMLPNLIHLDFSDVTKNDRGKTDFWTSTRVAQKKQTKRDR